MQTLQLPKLSEEDALGLLLGALKKPKTDSYGNPDYGHDLYLPNVMSVCFDSLQREWRTQNPNARVVQFRSDAQTNSEPFYDAAWNLCTRGILRPSPIYSQNGGVHVGIIGAGFMLTPYGRDWIQKTNGYECLPYEFGRFSQLLASHSSRFGDGYHIRSQEAVNCHRAHTYLACCAMCGAASESILLALAIAKAKDEERVLNDYRSSKGREKIENLILSNQNTHIKQQLPNYTSLLTYWRNYAAHGESTNISEDEAFTSLILLLRFAQLADERWEIITA